MDVSTSQTQSATDYENFVSCPVEVTGGRYMLQRRLLTKANRNPDHNHIRCEFPWAFMFSV